MQDLTPMRAGGGDRNIVLWELDDTGARPLRTLRGHVNKVMALCFTGDGRLLSASYDNTLRLWDVASGALLRVYQGHTAGLWSIALHGGLAYTAANDATLRRWSLATPGQWLWDLPESATSAAISPQGDRVAVGFKDGSLCLYPLPTDGGSAGVGWAEERSPTSTADGVGLREAQPKLRVQAPAPLLEQPDAHGADINRLAYSPDGQWLASAGHDATAKLWRLGGNGLQTAQTFQEHRAAVHVVAFSPDSRRLATASYDGHIGLYDVASGKGRLFPAHKDAAMSVAFTAAGLVSAGQDRRTRLWDVSRDPPQARDLPLANDTLMWATLRPDGREIASVGRELVVTLHPPDQPARARRLVGHEQAVFRAEYSPDGAVLATVGGDMTLRFWDVATAQALFSLRLPDLPQSDGPWDFAFRCLPADAPGPHAGHCWAAVPLTMGRLALYRFPYATPPASLGRSGK